MWKPKKVPKRSKDVVKKSLQAAREEEKEEEVEQHVHPNNPFEKYEQNNTLSIRVNNELDQLAAMYEGRFKLVYWLKDLKFWPDYLDQKFGNFQL